MKRRGLIAIIAIVVLVGGGAGLYVYLSGGSNSRASQQTQPVTVYVATTDIPAGTTNDKLAAMVTQKQVPGPQQAGAVTDLAQLEGRQALTSIQTGQQLTQSMFATAEQAAAAGGIKMPSGTVEIAVQLNALQSVGGQLRATNTVSVFVTATVGSSGDKQATRRVASHVLITKVVSGGATTTTTSSTGATPQPSASASTPSRSTINSAGTGMMLLLAVTPNDAARLIMAAKSGTITLARENDGSSANADQSSTVTVDKVLG